jgi:hypothetical protein
VRCVYSVEFCSPSWVKELFSVLTDQDLQDLQAKVEKLRSAAMDRLAGTLTSSGSIAHGRGV